MSEQAHGQEPPGQERPGPGSGQEWRGQERPPRGARRSWLASLFDFRFDSFVAPKMIRALYVLIVIVTVLTALIYVIIAFDVNTALGVLTLVIAAPLWTIVVIGVWRVVLEFFMAVLRMSEDIRAMRESEMTGRSS
jgi:hypothetical protein